MGEILSIGGCVSPKRHTCFECTLYVSSVNFDDIVSCVQLSAGVFRDVCI